MGTLGFWLNPGWQGWMRKPGTQAVQRTGGHGGVCERGCEKREKTEKGARRGAKIRRLLRSFPLWLLQSVPGRSFPLIHQIP